MKRKILALALTAVMLLTAFPMVISAEDEPNYDQYLPDPDTIITKGNLTDTITWEFVKSESTLYITGTGAMPDFSGTYKQPWGNPIDGMTGYNGWIKNYVISEGITYIGRFAFGGCSALTEINWPSTLEGVGDFLFDGCSKLTSVTLPPVETIHADMLKESRLKHVVVPEGVKKIDEIAFRAMYSLETVVLPESLEEIGAGAFILAHSRGNSKPSNIAHIAVSINDTWYTFEIDLTVFAD